MDRDRILLTPGPLTTTLRTKLAMLKDWGSWDADFNAITARLRGRLLDHPHVGDIRGRGFFWGIEFVQERATKRPFDPALKVNARVKAEAMKRGLLCYPMGGTLDGVRGDHMLLAPPFVVEEAQLDECIEKLDRAFGAVLAGVAKPAAGVKESALG